MEGGVKFVDSIPKTPSGKILRRIMRQQADQAGNVASKLWLAVQKYFHSEKIINLQNIFYG